MSLAFHMFSMDNNNVMPATDGWRKALRSYIGMDKTEEFFNCPVTGKPYHYVRQTIAFNKIKDPSRTILFYEDFGNHDQICIAFADGHVQSYGINDTWKNIEDLATHNKLILKAEEK